jgi:DNA-binding NarL/FixJ family response regulator
MNEPVLKVTHVLRVAVVASDPRRQALLSRLICSLGHIVVPDVESASVILTEGVALAGSLPTVSLGMDDEDHAGRLPPDASHDQIDAALRAVVVGLSVTLAEAADRRFDTVRDTDERMLLTPREIEVLTAVSNGSTNKEIARELGISRHTVKFHLESLMRKLVVSSRAEAVSKSIWLRLLEPHRV